MTKYTFKFNVEGGGSVDLDVTKEEFEKLSEFCEKELPDRDWKTEKLKPIEV